MTTKQTIEIEGLPEGWRAVAYRDVHINEYILTSWGVIKAKPEHICAPWLVVEKIQPLRIVLEETGEIRKPEIGEYIQNNGNFCKCHKPERWGYEHEIWREVKENDLSLPNEEPKLSLSIKQCKKFIHGSPKDRSDFFQIVAKFIKDK